MGDFLNLFLYLVQQIGVFMGVGAGAVAMLWFLRHARSQELVFNEAVRAERLGLVLIILSGLAIVMLHAGAGAYDVLLAPAFVLKWALIILLVCCTALRGHVHGVGRRMAAEGFAGANWLALFLVHITAPVAVWPLLLGLYGGWLVFFALVWMGSMLLLPHEHAARAVPQMMRRTAPPVPAAVKTAPSTKMAPPAAPQPVFRPAPIVRAVKKIIMPAPAPKAPLRALTPPALPEIAPHLLPEVVHPKAAPAPAHVAAAPAPHKPTITPIPAPKPAFSFSDADLPALRVMPKRPEDLGNEKRGPVVRFT